MRLFHPKMGYLTIGFLPWSGGYGISWGFSPLPSLYRSGYQFAKYGSIQFVTHEAWLDFGWWELWPIHFCKRGIGPFDPEIYSHSTGYRKPYFSADRWTGRTSTICGIVAFRHYFRLGQ